MPYLTVKEMPQDERPRERMERVGPQALSTAELLALILRTGVKDENVLTMATRLLVTYGGLAGLARAEFAQIASEHGMGRAKTAQILAALELGRRLMVESPEERFQIRCHQMTTQYHLMRPLYARGPGRLQPLQCPGCAIVRRFDIVLPNHHQR